MPLFIDDSNSYVPDIESDLPLPARAAEAMPDLTPADELAMRVRTIKLLSDLNGTPIMPTDEGRVEATELARRMIEDPKYRPAYSKYPNETLAYLAGMVAQSNCLIVEDLADFKNYIMNRLVYEYEHAKDAKTRIMALSKLGEIDGIDAFKKRSEMTMIVKPIEQVEKEIKEVLDNIEYAVLDDSTREINGLNGQAEPVVAEKT